ncbi:hypothetical protein DIC66_17165 [Rhodoferax lacus]|uniref:DUF3592 domain-containing protein n=1 Tax=Rhodoferax lacus TaxID=2184758 RepID=A0A3E1R900_9BURK|nr:DUF3592 domain-containing protein [Rhodoferax lacus]RFO95723.1 hypothetical protein DIC66_17165 [Rhodoferax lacus]
MQTATAITGLLLCLAMLWNLLREDLRRLGGEQTAIGKIVDIQTSVDSDRVSTYTAVVRFESENGPMQFVDGFSGTSRPREGSSVTVRYPNGQPHLAQIPRPLFRLLAYVVTTGLAVFTIAILTGVLTVPAG